MVLFRTCRGMPAACVANCSATSVPAISMRLFCIFFFKKKHDFNNLWKKNIWNKILCSLKSRMTPITQYADHENFRLIENSTIERIFDRWFGNTHAHFSLSREFLNPIIFFKFLKICKFFNTNFTSKGSVCGTRLHVRTPNFSKIFKVDADLFVF